MSNQQKKIEWDRPKLERFKKAWKLAVKEKSDSFVFDGDEYVRNYAKYLIEFLDSRLAPR